MGSRDGNGTSRRGFLAGLGAAVAGSAVISRISFGESGEATLIEETVTPSRARELCKFTEEDWQQYVPPPPATTIRDESGKVENIIIFSGNRFGKSTFARIWNRGKKPLYYVRKPAERTGEERLLDIASDLTANPIQPGKSALISGPESITFPLEGTENILVEGLEKLGAFSEASWSVRYAGGEWRGARGSEVKLGTQQATMPNQFNVEDGRGN